MTATAIKTICSAPDLQDVDGNQDWLGRFKSQELAHKAWQLAKISVVVGFMVRYDEYPHIVKALEIYKNRIQADYDQDKLTE